MHLGQHNKSKKLIKDIKYQLCRRNIVIRSDVFDLDPCRPKRLPARWCHFIYTVTI